MDCPQCSEKYSISIGTIHHGKNVGRTRHCTVCGAEWVTVEITKTEHAKMVKALVRDHTCRDQFRAIMEAA